MLKVAASEFHTIFLPLTFVERQAFIATNNQIESAEPLGEMPKDSRLCYVDLSSNSLSTVGTPRFPRAFQHIKTLRLAGNRIEYVEDDAAISLKSLERLDISGKGASKCNVPQRIPTKLCFALGLSTSLLLVKVLEGTDKGAACLAAFRRIVGFSLGNVLGFRIGNFANFPCFRLGSPLGVCPLK